MDSLTQQQQEIYIIERSLINFKKVGKPNLTPAKIRSRIQSLKESWEKFRIGHAALMTSTTSAQRLTMEYFTTKQFDLCEETYLTTLDYMSDALEEKEPFVSPHSSFEQSQLNASAVYLNSMSHLPPITLPPFHGRYEEWEPFRDRFNSLIIENKDLSNYSRMHYLTSCLKDQALECVNNIPVTADNFNIAWTTLKARYENKRRLINLHLSTLLNLAPVTRESATDIQVLRDKVNIALAALDNLDRSPKQLWDEMLVYIVSLKLDPVTRKAWHLKHCDADKEVEYHELNSFLASRARALEDCKPLTAGPARSTRSSAVHNAIASAQPAKKCLLCQENHNLNNCPQFTSKTPSERLEIVKAHRCCFNCLSKAHSLRECTSKYSCRVCQKRHHTLLHLGSDSSLTNKTDPSTTSQLCQAEASEPSETVTSLLASSKITSRKHVLLATAWVTVGVSSGRSMIVRALLDQGSEMTFVTETLAQTLRARRVRMPVSISAIGGFDAGTCRYATEITLSPRGASSPAFSTTALILRTLTSYSPQRLLPDSSIEHLSGLSMADPDPTSSVPIHIIIGADLYNDLLLTGVKKGPIGRPIAQETIFGWVVSGPQSSDSVQSGQASMASLCERESSIAVHHCLQAPSIPEELKKFWEVEEVPHSPSMSPDDERCETHFRDTHSRLPDGRYVVRLPFKSTPPVSLGDSRWIAVKRLNSLHRKFQINKDLASEYADFLSEYERLGHMRLSADCRSPDTPCVYIPHHPVFRDGSSTTHLRVVFNASSPTTNGSSLNDYLSAGPKLQTDLCAVVLQWRYSKYVYSADISKMYRQIRVDSRDVDYQRILWSPALSELPRDYQLLTVTYGTVSAPYLALRVLQQLVLDEGRDFPLAIPVLQHQIYVDDVLFGHDDMSTLQHIRLQLCALLRRGGFELRKWSSNNPTLLSDIDPSNHGLACDKRLQTDERVKVLGIVWHPSLDEFHFQVSLPPSPPRTKRTILSTIDKLFDPLGWVSPVIISTKILMQRLWLLKLDWDDSLPPDLLGQWNTLYSQLPSLNELRLPRWTGHHPDNQYTELHGFCDASSVAYAASVYSRIVSPSGKVIVTLLAGKSKVAPLNTISIPRLELCAAVLLSRLFEFVLQSSKTPLPSCFCWTDSSVVLTWLSQHPARWKTFVANRVTLIHTQIPHASWHHVPTDDCCSRGLTGQELINHPLWWTGPPWLKLPPSHWPSTTPAVPPDTPLEKSSPTIHYAHSRDSWDLASRYSSWTKLMRVTAYILKFVKACRPPKGEDPSRSHQNLTLSSQTMQDAQNFWFKVIQTEVFPTEIHALSQLRPVPSQSSLFPLHPFLDRNGVIRIGGRLRSAPLAFSVKHPVALAAHPLVSLFISFTHVRMLHSGLQLTLHRLRQSVWLLRARNLVKTIIYKCVKCARERAKVSTQLMGNLPEPRITQPSRSFLHCGVDYAGPMLVRASAGRCITSRKAYIALFICLATRAIHLELVGDYSTPAFRDAFSRFCSRRGLPQTMYSDNGTNFVGADRDLQDAYKKALHDPNFRNTTAADGVSWQFLPPSAPHFGGLWEAGVRSVKYHLRRVLGNHKLTFEEFYTLLCQIEACLNSRPLSPLSDTFDDYEALTPGHFLIGTPITVNPEPSILHLEENRLSRWQLVRRMAEHFWRMWQHDYVNTLQQRAKWRRPSDSILPGQLVVLRNSLLPPCKWELGRVTQCHPGADGLVRVVTVRTASSEYKRPIAKVCVLPVDVERPRPSGE